MHTISRRQLLTIVALLAPAAVGSRAAGQSLAVQPSAASPLPAPALPPGVRARLVNDVNGIRMHVLEAGYDGPRRPLVLLMHGFPELAYSWRKVMMPIAAAGYHVIAPDLRGYGRSGGTDVRFDDDLSAWRPLNEVTDMVALISAFGYRSAAAVIGHDFGSPWAAWCAVARPDVFRSVVLMSAPFGGTPAFPFDTVDATAATSASTGLDTIHEDLAKLTPPRKHYVRYYATREANGNMWRAPQGVHAFLRAYYHMKSADWTQNHPAPLRARTADEWSKLPRYYVMDLDKGMAETVAPEMPSASAIAANRWLPDEELRVYSGEYERNGFQGGLQSYRAVLADRFWDELKVFAGRTIDQPSMFIAGRSDWGAFQTPGALERMQKRACTRMTAVHFIDDAGHWVQQEQHERVSTLLVEFLQRYAPRDASG